jgi:hypothetical protein
LPCVLQLWTSVPCQCGLQCCHVSYNSGHCFPTEVGSDITMCPTTLNLASLPGWALVLPHVLYLRASPLGQGGLRHCRMSHGSRPRLTAGVSSGASTCPSALCGPWASYKKKGLAGLPMLQDAHVSKAHSRVSMASDTQATMACKASRQAAWKMCDKATTMQRRPY